ncbi:DUF2255 family protein [Kaistella jeonii]|uniref:DUF2255 family protein n=1 Tax=Kaistella jeonii TaxID=266749 RepID=A0A0C1FAE9_9FLAO|nr:DUF2255 family protein [Kaistella jeonii]KIA88888.1 hypothetical protein OA86_09595 [Kaistella jeonii]SFC12319.1 hypothetical protein SAMN05421876_1079 [Kaistella jeonii]VEI94508.1 Uncharacterized protein conserved in bacteria (DUF2255) [Kaistella jeonii]
MNNEIALKYIESNNHIGIKAGTERDTFLEIWMVIVEDRIFARSWGFAERSWYNTFVKNPVGEIQCGDEIFKIKAEIPADENGLMEKINDAYLSKYTSTEHNKKYAVRIIEEAHIEKTMEFILL